MPCIRTPMIGIKAGEAKGLQERFELQKDLIFAAPKDIRQNRARVMINRMPQPAWVPFVADKTPHFIHFGFASLLNVHKHLVWLHGVQQRRIDRFQAGFFLPERAQHGGSTDAQPPCRIAHATGVEAHVNDLLLHLRQSPPVAVLKQKAPRETRSILTLST